MKFWRHSRHFESDLFVFLIIFPFHSSYTHSITGHRPVCMLSPPLPAIPAAAVASGPGSRYLWRNFRAVSVWPHVTKCMWPDWFAAGPPPAHQLVAQQSGARLSTIYTGHCTLQCTILFYSDSKQNSVILHFCQNWRTSKLKVPHKSKSYAEDYIT